MFKYGINYNITRLEKDEEGQILIIEVTIQEQKYTICNLYAPNDDTPSFFIKVANILDIIAGDLSLCFDLENAKRGIMYNNNKALKVLLDYMDEN